MKERLEKLTEELSKITNKGLSALWLSGGKDSTLLLELMLRNSFNFSLLNFNYTYSREQKKRVDYLIAEKNLIVYSYAPLAFTLVGNKKDISIISIYAAGKNGASVPLIADLVDGDKCAFDLNIKLNKKRQPPIIFDNHIWGSKKSDSHWIDLCIDAEKWQVGNVNFFAPLFEWKDSEVLEALNYLGIEYKIPTEKEDTGSVVCCFECLKPNENKSVFCHKENKTIPVVSWNPKENLENWKNGHRCQ